MSAYALVSLGPARMRVARRPVAVCVALVVLLAALVLAALALGSYPVSPRATIEVALGRGSFDDTFVIGELRMPRIACGLLVGLALGAAGAIFQSLTRNPLGSPDIIGLTYGASAGAVAQIVLVGAGTLAVATSAVGGALATALAMYVLTLRGGRVEGYRFVLVGIGVGAMMLALTDYLVSRARLEDAMAASVWLTGSLADRGWEHALPLAGILLALVPALVCVAPGLRMLELGDDSARALGVRAEAVRGVAGLSAVVLAAVATAAAGPIAFVALAAPQIAKRLTGASGPGVIAAALTGAVLLAASDLAAENAFGRDLPVGLVTGIGGGAFLIWLLGRGLRGRSA